jgi:N-acetylglucosaminyl-diphospho-decaprenol L-rhamnosyltransferase
MDLSIIIVNWNSKEYLQKCIGSIFDSIQGIEYEIVVIDSGSFDGCGEILQQRYPQVHFIQSEKNLGFAKANNAAFLKLSGQFVLFLNPDTEVLGSAVNLMFDFSKQHSNAGAVGCKLLNADTTVQTSCIQSFPTILNQILDSELLRKLCPKSPLWGNAPLVGIQNKPEEVEAISGACMMIKRSVFEQVGLFSENYFMYTEDIDLCYKISQAGYENYYVPGATVIHFGGGSSMKQNENYFSTVLMKESSFIFFLKTKGRTYATLYKISMTFASLIRLTVLLFSLPWLVFTTKRNALYHSFGKWQKILSWSLGREVV